MATDLRTMYISRITNMKFMDKNTGEVLDEWDFEKCKDLDLNIEVEVTSELSDFKERLKRYESY